MVIVVTELIAIIGGHGKLTGHCVTVVLIYIKIKYSLGSHCKLSSRSS